MLNDSFKAWSPHLQNRARLALSAALSASILLCALVLCAPGARASGPATVTVRAVGLNDTSVLPLSTVTTNETRVSAAGHPEDTCSGTSALGALQLASDGQWTGKWYGSSYLVEGIREAILTTPEYWSFWLNNRYQESAGLCETQLANGDQILLFPECFPEKGECEGQAKPPRVLAIEIAPIVEAKQPVPVRVVAYPNPNAHEPANGEPMPVEGASIVDSEGQTLTDEDGHATLTFSLDSTFTLRATGPEGEGIPAEATVCVHEGNDGACGTPAISKFTFEAPPSSTVTNTGQQTTPSVSSQKGIALSATGVLQGHHYPRSRAPRVLSGAVFSSSTITSLSLRLQRAYGKRCFDYNGARESFQRERCSRQASFFKIKHNGSSFSYLLPRRLPPGRYLLELKATDSSGDRTELVRGSTQITFYVD